MKYKIRKAQKRDSRPITAIFNHYIKNSFAAFTEEPVGTDYYDRLTDVVGEYPFYVVETRDDEKAVGYAFLHPFHSAKAFRETAEITYFIAEEHTGQGNGVNLLNILKKKGQQMGIKTIVSGVSSLNKRSLDFHLKNGFAECGRIKQVGEKLNNHFDLVWLQTFI